MRIEEIVVADDIPATPIADGQGANLPGADAPEGANTQHDAPVEKVEVPGAEVQEGANAVAAGAEPVDKELQVPIDEHELTKDLEEVEGEYAPPSNVVEEAGDAIQVARAEEADAHEAIAAMEGYFLLCKRAIENKTCSMESLQLIRLGVEPYLKAGKMAGLAMEGREGADLLTQHQLALEGIKESIKSAMHSVHTAHSASVDNIKMIFTSVESDVKRYEAGLAKALAKFEDFTKANPKQELHLDLHVLHNFFNLSGKEAGRQLGNVLRTDEKVDAYILTKFSVDVEKQLEGFLAALNGEKTFAGLLAKTLKLKSPIELFDKRILGSDRDSAMLGGYYATIYQQGLSGFSGEKFGKLSRLEQLGSSARVAIRRTEGNAWRAMHNSINPIRMPVEGMFSEVLTVPPQQIKDVASIAGEYLKNITFFLQLLKNSSRTYDQALEKYLKFEAEDVNHKQADDIYEYLDALEDGIVSTCRQEVTRALKAVFYCIALINRATFVNK